MRHRNNHKSLRPQKPTSPPSSTPSPVAMDSVNWFPGHMKKTSDLIKRLSDKVEAVIEILDARIPSSGRNPLILEFTAHLPRLIVLNKTDLADPRITLQWEKYFQAQGYTVLSLCSVGENSANYRKKIRERMGTLLRASLNHPPTFTAMICGIPNVGKSTLINLILGGKKTKVGNRPGITMDKQFLKINDEKPWALVDMPGLLMPKLTPQESFHLALCGNIKDGIYDEIELASQLLSFLFTHKMKDKTQKMIEVFDLPLSNQSDLEGRSLKKSFEEIFWLEEIAKRRGYLIKGQEIDYSAAASLVIRYFRSGKLGRISLEYP